MPLDITTDPAHGGRWTSLRAEEREWLWRRGAPERESVSPADPFVDAGGLEECVPTVRGTPDHGDAWSRAWTREADRESVDCDRFTLTRTIRRTADGAEADYVLAADPGFGFVWAAHALLDLSEGAAIHLPDGAGTRLYPEAAPLLDGGWPPGAPWVEGGWPAPRGLRLDRLGPDDGTAVGAVVDAPPLLRARRHGPPLARRRGRRATGLRRPVAQPRRFPRRAPLPQHGRRTDARPGLRPRRSGPWRCRPGPRRRRGAVEAHPHHGLPLCLNRPARQGVRPWIYERPWPPTGWWR
ncbi:hypothetical protein GCM10010515_50830 [Streptomyces fructofermentans]|uniref:Uncharacterized protein n=1 Tax=Streptomyces fructofermentans TaxID=152141 RepID=A0A918KUH6_9ACTN|nr:hypothetical protein GCM10010515_50830 [Streptomyces fructofermentans]